MVKNIYLMFLIGFCISFAIGKPIINLITRLKGGQNILEYVDVHKVKQGTPTMGGIIFITGLIVCFFTILDNNSRLISITILVTIAYGILGFLDDFLKIKFKHNEGLKAYQKAVGQVGIAIIVALFVYRSGLISNSIILPFGLKEIEIGWLIIPFIIFFYVAVTNSVNLTDGLDGLAGGVSSIFLFGFLLIMTMIVDKNIIIYSDVLGLEIKNIILLSAGFIGCIIAFLTYNWYPAKVFMGDTGSLAIGGFIATILTVTRMYLLMLILGIMFVINTMSVVIQVGYYKLTHKRIFKMAPLHHHFEKSDIKETRVVFGYIVITLIAVCIGMLIYF